ncbi:hypothetical protein BDB01DRAFT_478813 [Pilobolus umbonatus]|nr:hypothetical protein BDB01DRAFT_478813 [Pilobolus umbonatus]
MRKMRNAKTEWFFLISNVKIYIVPALEQLLILSLNFSQTSCVFTKDLKLLKVEFLDNIKEDGWEERADNINIFLIPCIVSEFYRVSQIQPSDRSNIDCLMIDTFGVYMKTMARDFMVKHAIKSNGVAHWVLTIPDSWELEYFDQVKQYMANSGMPNMENLLIIKQSHAFIRRLQSSQYEFQFKNGEYYIICHFKKDYEVAIYGFEIGRPIKGLKNIAYHSLANKCFLRLAYKEQSYLISKLFDGDEKEADKYNLDLKVLIECCYDEYDKVSLFS